MTYLNCALIPLAKDDVDAYRKLAEQMAEVYLDHGAVAYRDHVGEDLDVSEQGAIGFPDALELAEEETLVLTTVRFDSRAHRDEVEAALQQDPRIGEIMGQGFPFDPSRMIGGGFATIVDA